MSNIQPPGAQPTAAHLSRAWTKLVAATLGVVAVAGVAALLWKPVIVPALGLSTGFPIGEFARVDGAASLALDMGSKPALARSFSFSVNAGGGDKAYEFADTAYIDGGFAASGDAVAAAYWAQGLEEAYKQAAQGEAVTLDAAAPVLSFHVLKSGAILVVSNDAWAEENPSSAAPDGIYMRRTTGAAPTKSPKPTKTPQSTVTPSLPTPTPTPIPTPTSTLMPLPMQTPTPTPELTDLSESLVLSMSGLYELVETGIENDDAFNRFYYEGDGLGKRMTWKSAGLSWSAGLVYSDAMRAVLLDYVLGSVGSARLDFVYDKNATDIFILNLTEAGKFTVSQERFESYLRSNGTDIVYTISGSVGYDFNEGGWMWADVDDSDTYGLKQLMRPAITWDAAKSVIHVSGRFDLPPALIDTTENSVVKGMGLELDIFTRDDGTTDAEGYYTVYCRGTEYLKFHIVLNAELGRIHQDPIKPGARSYVIFLGDDLNLGDNVLWDYDQVIEEQDDGTFKVTWTKKGMEGRVPLTMDYYMQARALYLKKLADEQALGVRP